MRLFQNILVFIVLLVVVASCNLTKNLKPNEYMLMKNSVTIKDAKPDEFYDLIDYVRPIPNKPLVGFILLKPYLYANFQPITDSVTGEIIKDSSFRKWLRENGEKQILFDTLNVVYSVKQIQSVLKKMGYFDAVVNPEIEYLKDQKVSINYSVNVKRPYYIREITYKIGITEYRRIVIQDTVNSLIKTGMKYNENLIISERNRIVANIRNEGYYYVTPSIITIEVDTINSKKNLNSNGDPTVSLTVLVNFDRITDLNIKKKHQFKYTFDKVYVYTNYDPRFEKGAVILDTTIVTAQNDFSDPTTYYFITPLMMKKDGEIVHINDYRYKIIIESIFTKKGLPYSQESYNKSYKRFRDLQNFSIINITFQEDVTKTDTNFKKGSIHTIYKLSRTKPWGIKPQFEVRTDLTSFSGTYFNKNIFKGAEYFNINAYGSILYYNWWNNILGREISEEKIYAEVGGSVSLDLPRYLFLGSPQNINSINYKSSIKVGGSYSQLFSRLMLYANLTYLWSPNQSISHSFSPIDISTIDSRGTRNNNLISSYPESYQRKFDKSILLSLKYGFTYYYPKKRNKIDFRISTLFESVGLAITSINYLVNNTERWKLLNTFNYCAFERGDINIRYTRTINKQRSIATRLNIGFAIPITSTDVIPFERSFYVGGANSMRGWTYRQLGPGGFKSEDFIERTGDFKLELNLEYRGTIYKFVKYGIFADFGNVWLSTKYDNMENAEFQFNRFYKEIAMCAGVGLRLDFSFFILRLDYGLPIYDPNNLDNQNWIHKSWITNNRWQWAQGIQFGLGHAF